MCLQRDGPMVLRFFSPIAQTSVPVLSTQDTALLVVAALLCFWLWLLVRRREETHRVVRPTPLSHDELGRMVFTVARAGDVRAWRGLFLNGGEAAARMGENADHWLETHDVAHLASMLRALADCIPKGAIYLGCGLQEDGRLALHIREKGGNERWVAFGVAEQVGVAWRLVSVHALSPRVVGNKAGPSGV